VHVLAIDLGTGGPKVALIDESGAALAWTARPVTTHLLPGGGAEQDPQEMWTAIVDAAREVLQHGDEIAAIAVTSQYMSIVPVAADGTPVGPCILWMDTRGVEHNLGLLSDENFLLFAERHGLIPLPSGNDGLAHIDVLRRLHPQAYAQADAFVEPMDYIASRLCGSVMATQSTMFGQLVCDNRAWGATTYDDELVRATGLDPTRLPRLVPMTEPIGTLIGSAADELGLAAGVPVAVATIDSITSAIGTGALTPTDVSLVIGTTSVVVTHTSAQRNDLGRALLTVPSPVRQSYFVMAENGVGGRAAQWAQVTLGLDTIDHFLELAGQAPVGSDGVVCAPWFTGALAPAPNDDLRAGWVGLGLRHDQRHLARSVLEGVAANVAWLLPEVASFLDVAVPDVLRFGGGAALSPLWAQIIADAAGVVVHRLAEPRVTNARGAAFLALAQLGVIDLGDTPALLRVASVHEPVAAHHDVLTGLVDRLRSLHSSLA
jgi:xylulokinase